MKTHQPAHLKPMKSEERELRFAIGEEIRPKHFGMWDGPTPFEKVMLETEGRSNKSRIIRFNKDETDEIIWWWNDDDLLWEDESR